MELANCSNYLHYCIELWNFRPNLPFKYSETYNEMFKSTLTTKIHNEASVTWKLFLQEGNSVLENSIRVIAETHYPRDPTVLPSLSPTFLQFNVCKRILFQSLAPSRMVFLECPRAMFTSWCLPKFFSAVCHNTLWSFQTRI